MATKDDSWEATRAWIMKHQCYRCIYGRRVHHSLDPFCNYSEIKEKTRTTVATERGEKIRDWKKCKLFEARGQQRDLRPCQLEEFILPCEAENPPREAKETRGGISGFYTTDKPEERAKCLSCDRRECTNCMYRKGTKKQLRRESQREVATSMFASGNSTDDVAYALGISKAAAAGYLAHYRRRRKK